jgi:hypothetical protein
MTASWFGQVEREVTELIKSQVKRYVYVRIIDQHSLRNDWFVQPHLGRHIPKEFH